MPTFCIVVGMSDLDIIDMRAAQAAQRQRSRDASASEVLVVDHRTGIPLNISQDVPAFSPAVNSYR